MAQLSHWTLILSLAGSLAAQSLPDALAMVPEDTTDLVILKDGGATDRKFQAFSGRFGKGSSLHKWEEHFGWDLARSQSGPALFLERNLPGKKESRDVLLVPVSDYKALVKELKAVPSGKLRTFKRGDQAYFLASRSGFALFSKDQALLQEVLQTRGGIQASLAPQLPWIQSKDLVCVIPEKSLHKELADAKADLSKPEDPDKPKSPMGTNTKAAKDMFKVAMDTLDASATFFAVSMDLPEDRGLKASARVFFRPGAPMVSWAPKGALHPLMGVPATPYALAMGGPSSKGIATWITEVVTPLFHGECTPEDLKALKTLQGDIQGNIRSAAWILGAPVAPGRGLLSGTGAILKVDDPVRYLDGLEKITRFQAQLAARKPKGEEGAPAPVPAFTRGVLPGTPSAGVSTPLGGAEATPQDMVFKGMIFGGDSIQMSIAQADDHTMVVVFGGAETLKTALDAYRSPVGTLDRDAGVKAVDAMLPADAPWRLYLHPGGMRDFAQSFLEVLPLLPGGKALPKVDAAPPAALALSINAQGAELSVAVMGSTLDAIAKWGKEMDQLFPKKPKAEPVEEPGETPAEAPAEKPVEEPVEAPSGKP